jgi:hypothetical protein
MPARVTKEAALRCLSRSDVSTDWGYRKRADTNNRPFDTTSDITWTAGVTGGTDSNFLIEAFTTTNCE